MLGAGHMKNMNLQSLNITPSLLAFLISKVEVSD